MAECLGCGGLGYIVDGFPPGECCPCPPPYDECPHQGHTCQRCHGRVYLAVVPPTSGEGTDG